MLRRLAASGAICVALASPLFANQLTNPGFELGPPRGFGNEPNSPTQNAAGWQIQSGQLNVVQVDGPGGWSNNNYGNAGPERDASAAGPGQVQRYLDIDGGNGVVFQTFTAQCGGSVTFGGWFSTRMNNGGTGSIELRTGAVPGGGTIVGQALPVTLPGGASRTDPWTQVSATAQLNAGQTYTYVVSMDNALNFDEGFVNFDQQCLPDDTCCTPWNEARLADALVISQHDFGDPYQISFNPDPVVRTQLNAYVNYVQTLNPNCTQLWMQAVLHDHNPSSDPAGNWNGTILAHDWMVWDGTGTGPNTGPVFQNATLVPNRRYKIRTHVGWNAGCSIQMDFDCENHHVFYDEDPVTP